MPIAEHVSQIGSAPSIRRGVTWNVLSLALAGCLGILANALILRVRGYATLGVFNQAYAIYIVASQVCTFGVHLSVLRLVSLRPNAKQEAAQALLAGVIVVTVFASAVTSILLISRDAIAALFDSAIVGESLTYLAPGLIFFACNKTLLNAINGANAMRAFAIFTGLRFVLLFGTLVVMVAAAADDHFLPACFSVAEIALFVVMTLYIHARLFSFRRPTGLLGYAREHLSFGVRGCLSRTLEELNFRIDILMLGIFSTDSVVGIYSFPALLLEGFWQVADTARRNIDPLLGSAIDSGDLGSIENLAKTLVPTIFRRSAFTATGLIVLYPLGFLILQKPYSLTESWSVFAILAVGLVVSVPMRSFSGIFPQGNRPGTNTLILIIATIVNVLLNALLIPVLSLYGAATATTSAVILEAVIIRIAARRCFNLHL